MAYFAEAGVESRISLLLGRVSSEYSSEVRAALLGNDEELDRLLKRLPGSPGTETLSGQKVSVWIDMYKAELAIMQAKSGVLTNREGLDAFILATLNRVADVPEDDLNDFHPSKLLLSASIQVDLAQSDEVPTDYSRISRKDVEISKHPMVTDDSKTAQWWKRGRSTPVPKVLRAHLPRMTVASYKPKPDPNPVILAEPTPHRPPSSFPAISYRSSTPGPTPQAEHSGREEIRGRSETRPRLTIKLEPSSAAGGSGSRPKSRSSRTRSSEGTGGERVHGKGNQPRKIRTGKRKERDELGDAMDVDDPIGEEDELEESEYEPPTPVSKKSNRRTRSSSRPPVSEQERQAATPANTPCALCIKRHKECMFEAGMFACVACRAGKSKCSGVPETWRVLRTQQGKGRDQRSQHPAQPRQLSKSRASGSKEGGSRLPDSSPESSRPSAKKRRQARTPAPRSTSRARAVRPDDGAMLDGNGEPASTKAGPSSISVPDLGQVPSSYVYLLSDKGKDVSQGIRMETRDQTGGEKLGEAALLERVGRLEEENRTLHEKVEGLTTTVAVLMASFNGHTALLDSHRGELLKLVGRSVPSDRATDNHIADGDSRPIPSPPLAYPPSMLFGPATPPPQPIKDPNVYWNSGLSPSSSIVQEYVNQSAFTSGVISSPGVSNRTHSPRIPAGDDSVMGGPSDEMEIHHE